MWPVILVPWITAFGAKADAGSANAPGGGVPWPICALTGAVKGSPKAESTVTIAATLVSIFLKAQE
jgi:hypothetical protein